MKQTKSTKITVIIVTAVAIAIIALAIYLNRPASNTYTVSGFGTKGASCLALIPECLRTNIVLEDSSGKQLEYYIYETKYFDARGNEVEPYDINPGDKLQIVSEQNQMYLDSVQLVN